MSRGFFFPADNVLVAPSVPSTLHFGTSRGRHWVFPSTDCWAARRATAVLLPPDRERRNREHRGPRCKRIKAKDEGWRYLRFWLFDTEPGILEPREAVAGMVEKMRALREAVGDDLS